VPLHRVRLTHIHRHDRSAHARPSSSCGACVESPATCSKHARETMDQSVTFITVTGCREPQCTGGHRGYSLRTLADDNRRYGPAAHSCATPDLGTERAHARSPLDLPRLMET
jgi:hypothetical protein